MSTLSLQTNIGVVSADQVFRNTFLDNLVTKVEQAYQNLKVLATDIVTAPKQIVDDTVNMAVFPYQYAKAALTSKVGKDLSAAFENFNLDNAPIKKQNFLANLGDVFRYMGEGLDGIFKGLGHGFNFSSGKSKLVWLLVASYILSSCNKSDNISTSATEPESTSPSYSNPWVTLTPPAPVSGTFSLGDMPFNYILSQVGPDQWELAVNSAGKDITSGYIHQIFGDSLRSAALQDSIGFWPFRDASALNHVGNALSNIITTCKSYGLPPGTEIPPAIFSKATILFDTIKGYIDNVVSTFTGDKIQVSGRYSGTGLGCDIPILTP